MKNALLLLLTLVVVMVVLLVLMLSGRRDGDDSTSIVSPNGAGGAGMTFGVVPVPGDAPERRWFGQPSTTGDTAGVPSLQEMQRPMTKTPPPETGAEQVSCAAAPGQEPPHAQCCGLWASRRGVLLIGSFAGSGSATCIYQ